MLLIVKPWSLLKLFILLIWSASLTLLWKSLSSLSITLLESQSIQWLSMYVVRLQIYLYFHTCRVSAVLLVLWSEASLSPRCKLDHSCGMVFRRSALCIPLGIVAVWLSWEEISWSFCSWMQPKCPPEIDIIWFFHWYLWCKEWIWLLIELLVCPLNRFVLGSLLSGWKLSGNRSTGTLELSGIIHDLQPLWYCKFVRFFLSKLW